MEFVATCPKGFERLLADELAGLGARQRAAAGGSGARLAALWSRTRTGPACGRGWRRACCSCSRAWGRRDADALYEGRVGRSRGRRSSRPGRRSRWTPTGRTRALRNTQFVALRAKDAVVDRVLAATRRASRVTDPARPDLTVSVRLWAASGRPWAVDLAGEPLFRRGYGTCGATRAWRPLRPDYAAALLASGRVGRASSAAGTADAHAALWAGTGERARGGGAGVALDRAPGLLRARWGFAGWAGHDAAAWAGPARRGGGARGGGREERLLADGVRTAGRARPRRAARRCAARGFALEAAFCAAWRRFPRARGRRS